MVVVSALRPVGGRWRSGHVLSSCGAVGVSAVVRSVSGCGPVIILIILFVIEIIIVIIIINISIFIKASHH